MMPEVGDTRSVKLAEGVEMTFCWIPPGRFRMGSRDGRPNEQPVHEVEISKGFWLGWTPVMQRQYAAFDPEHKNHFHGNQTHPAEGMQWYKAVEFCKWLTGRLNSLNWSGWVAGLPSEAQWEYACRSGTQSDYYSGDGESAMQRVGCFRDKNAQGTHSVGAFTPNMFGLNDMHGGIREWCRDGFQSNAYRLRAELTHDAFVPDSGMIPKRITRGGSWFDRSEDCQSASRGAAHPSLSHNVRGFRAGIFSISKKNPH